MENKNPKEFILAILLLPLILLVLLGMLIITPFDYLKYKRTRYYRDTKEKYSWLCTSSYYIKFYDLIKKANLPIDHYRCNDAPITGYGFFVYKDILILGDCDPHFDEEKNIWLVEIEDEYVDIKDDVRDTINRCNELLKTDVCKKAVVLIDKELYEQYPFAEYENIKFLPMQHDLDAEAVKSLFKETPF